MTRRRHLVVGIAWVALAWWGWAVLAPSQLGGPVSYTIVTGSSMKPALEPGDLVVVRPARRYRMGDVVAYRAESGAVVLHRIVRRLGDRFVLQGDSNQWTDPDQPSDAAILGRLDHRLPKAGWVIEWLRRPVVASLVVGLISFWVGCRYQRRGAVLVAPGAATTALLVVAGVASIVWPGAARAATNTVPVTRLGVTTQAITADALKPGACAGLTLDRLVTGSGTIDGTAGNDLVLAGPGLDTLWGLGGNDCLLGGGGVDVLNGGFGQDVCLGGPGIDTFTGCETAAQ